MINFAGWGELKLYSAVKLKIKCESKNTKS